eukprot:g271.t1
MNFCTSCGTALDTFDQQTAGETMGSATGVGTGAGSSLSLAQAIELTDRRGSAGSNSNADVPHTVNPLSSVNLSAFALHQYQDPYLQQQERDRDGEDDELDTYDSRRGGADERPSSPSLAIGADGVPFVDIGIATDADIDAGIAGLAAARTGSGSPPAALASGASMVMTMAAATATAGAEEDEEDDEEARLRATLEDASEAKRLAEIAREAELERLREEERERARQQAFKDAYARVCSTGQIPTPNPTAMPHTADGATTDGHGGDGEADGNGDEDVDEDEDSVGIEGECDWRSWLPCPNCGGILRSGELVCGQYQQLAHAQDQALFQSHGSGSGTRLGAGSECIEAAITSGDGMPTFSARPQMQMQMLPLPTSSPLVLSRFAVLDVPLQLPLSLTNGDRSTEAAAETGADRPKIYLIDDSTESLEEMKDDLQSSKEREATSTGGPIPVPSVPPPPPPSQSPLPPAAAAGALTKQYETQQGDTLQTVAIELGVSVPDLLEKCGPRYRSTDGMVYAGQRLRIGSSDGGESAEPTSAESADGDSEGKSNGIRAASHKGQGAGAGNENTNANEDDDSADNEQGQEEEDEGSIYDTTFPLKRHLARKQKQRQRLVPRPLTDTIVMGSDSLPSKLASQAQTAGTNTDDAAKVGGRGQVATSSRRGGSSSSSRPRNKGGAGTRRSRRSKNTPTAGPGSLVNSYWASYLGRHRHTFVEQQRAMIMQQLQLIQQPPGGGANVAAADADGDEEDADEAGGLPPLEPRAALAPAAARARDRGHGHGHRRGRGKAGHHHKAGSMALGMGSMIGSMTGSMMGQGSTAMMSTNSSLGSVVLTQMGMGMGMGMGIDPSLSMMSVGGLMSTSLNPGELREMQLSMVSMHMASMSMQIGMSIGMGTGMGMGMGLGMDADPAGRPSMTMQEQMTMLDLQSEQVSDGKAATAAVSAAARASGSGSARANVHAEGGGSAEEEKQPYKLLRLDAAPVSISEMGQGQGGLSAFLCRWGAFFVRLDLADEGAEDESGQDDDGDDDDTPEQEAGSREEGGLGAAERAEQAQERAGMRAHRMRMRVRPSCEPDLLWGQTRWLELRRALTRELRKLRRRREQAEAEAEAEAQMMWMQTEAEAGAEAAWAQPQQRALSLALVPIMAIGSQPSAASHSTLHSASHSASHSAASVSLSWNYREFRVRYPSLSPAIEPTLGGYYLRALAPAVPPPILTHTDGQPQWYWRHTQRQADEAAMRMRARGGGGGGWVSSASSQQHTHTEYTVGPLVFMQLGFARMLRAQSAEAAALVARAMATVYRVHHGHGHGDGGDWSLCLDLVVLIGALTMEPANASAAVHAHAHAHANTYEMGNDDGSEGDEAIASGGCDVAQGEEGEHAHAHTNGHASVREGPWLVPLLWQKQGEEGKDMEEDEDEDDNDDGGESEEEALLPLAQLLYRYQRAHAQTIVCDQYKAPSQHKYSKRQQQQQQQQQQQRQQGREQAGPVYKYKDMGSSSNNSGGEYAQAMVSAGAVEAVAEALMLCRLSSREHAQEWRRRFHMKPTPQSAPASVSKTTSVRLLCAKTEWVLLRLLSKLVSAPASLVVPRLVATAPGRSLLQLILPEIVDVAPSYSKRRRRRLGEEYQYQYQHHYSGFVSEPPYDERAPEYAFADEGSVDNDGDSDGGEAHWRLVRLRARAITVAKLCAKRHDCDGALRGIMVDAGWHWLLLLILCDSGSHVADDDGESDEDDDDDDDETEADAEAEEVEAAEEETEGGADANDEDEEEEVDDEDEAAVEARVRARRREREQLIEASARTLAYLAGYDDTRRVRCAASARLRRCLGELLPEKFTALLELCVSQQKQMEVRGQGQGQGLGQGQGQERGRSVNRNAWTLTSRLDSAPSVHPIDDSTGRMSDIRVVLVLIIVFNLVAA